MNVQKARAVMKDAFKGDPHFRQAYVDNVAMLLHDSHGITEYDARNAAANDIIALIFERGEVNG